MPFIEYAQRLYPLQSGENSLGPETGADIRLPELQPGFRLGIKVELQGAFAYAVGDGDGVQINGRPLSKEPIPLFHGDTLSLQGSTMVFLDDVGTPKDGSGPESRPPNAVNAEPEAPAEVAAAPASKRKLIGVLRRHDTDDVYAVDRSEFKIGREQRCDLLILDHSVSRLQAEITVISGHHVLHDYGLTETRVNGRPVAGPHRLQPGDVIQIGKYEFTFSRRPATAEELADSNSVMPIRSTVPDAPTLMPEGEKKESESRILTWVLLAILGALLTVIVLG